MVFLPADLVVLVEAGLDLLSLAGFLPGMMHLLRRKINTTIKLLFNTLLVYALITSLCLTSLTYIMSILKYQFAETRMMA